MPILWPRLGWACVSAALLTAAVPPVAWGWLAGVALVPLVLAVHGASPGSAGLSVRWAALMGGVFGAVSAAGMYFWLWSLPAFNGLDAAILGLYLALYPAAWCAALAWLRERRLPWVLSGAAGWTLLHLLRARADFLSLPWEPLSHSQTQDLPLLQIASLGGAPLLGFLVCLGNLALAGAWRARDVRRLAAPGAALVALYGWGFLRARSPAPGEPLEAAIIQPGPGAASTGERMVKLRALTREALEAAPGAHPELVVWPESAVHGLAFDSDLRDEIGVLAAQANLPILFGSADFGKYAEYAAPADAETQFKNQAFFIGPEGAPQEPYTKNRLVPFAEAVPWEGRISWPSWLVARPRHGISGTAPGLFRLADGRRIGVLICWENLFTDLSARLVREGALAIVQLTNDSDFQGSAEPSQHSVASQLRAVEYARPVILASTSGPSLAINSRGRVTHMLTPLAPGGASMTVAVNTSVESTVYAHYGLLWLWAVGIVAAAGFLEGLRRRP
jgi:apolipoprotein N-acyltransferase